MAPMKPWLIWLLLFLGVEAALLASNAALDTYLWRATRWAMGSQDAYDWATYKDPHPTDDTPWCKTGKPPMNAKLYKRTEKFWRLFRDLGEPQMTVILVFLVALYDRRRWKAAAMLLAGTLAAGGAG